MLQPGSANENPVPVECDTRTPTEHHPLDPKTFALNEVDEGEAGDDCEENGEVRIKAVDGLIALAFHLVLEEVIHGETSGDCSFSSAHLTPFERTRNASSRTSTKFDC